MCASFADPRCGPAGDSTGTHDPHAKRQSQSTVLAVLGSPGCLTFNRQARSGLAA